ncbi:MAG TPA: glycosyltransferase [Bacteroidota bacterium]|nr:glycosyltransferase [Bacteroidota bacterium]
MDSVRRYAVLVPVFNDWACASILIMEVRKALDCVGRSTFYLIDDGSYEDEKELESILLDYNDVIIVRLKRNLGHQKAIAIGLCVIQRENCYDGVIVMDSDGEDRPEGICQLIESSVAGDEKCIVFAKRARRSEGALFKIMYSIYKKMSVSLTGYVVNIGNFSYIPSALLSRICVISELWIHYPAAIMKSKIKILKVPLDRGKRYIGNSKMNMTSLVTHGLGAMSVFSDVLGVRVIISISSLIGLIGVLTVLFSILVIGFPQIRGHEIYLSLTVAVMLLAQLVVGSFAFTFSVLNNRKGYETIPIRDYKIYIQKIIRATIA